MPHKKMYKKAEPKKFEFARVLRKTATEQEKILWQELRNKKLGFKFRRQHPIDEYIVDFICIDKKLIIEIDGFHHITKEGMENDKMGDILLKHYNFRILRFFNSEIESNLEDVLNKIREALR